VKHFSAVLSILLSLFSGSHAYSASLVINEIMFNPNGNENAREYVEILNLSGQTVSLEGCSIGQGDSFDKIIATQGTSWLVPPGGFALIMDPDYFSAGELYAGIPDSTLFFTVPDKAIGSGGLSNTNPKSVSLLSANGDTLSSVSYLLDCPAGHSWERVMPSGGDGADNYRPSKESDGTPGRVNSVTPPSINPSLSSDCLRYGTSEPKQGEGFDLYLSCRNSGLVPLAGITVRVKISPDISIGSVTFDREVAPGEKSGEEILHIPSLPGGSLQIEAVIDSPGSINWASDDTLRVDLDVPVSVGTVILNEIMAAPSAGPEWVEALNTGNAPVSLRKWSMSDRTGKLSEGIGTFAFLPSGGYAVITGDSSLAALPSGALFLTVKKFPSLNNDGDSVILFDASGGIADSVVYSSATADVSLELISPRLRKSTTGWAESTDISGSTPGARNSIFFDPDSGESSENKAVLLIEPNPFLEKTSLTYRLPFPLARVRMTVYDRRGRKVAVIRESSESGYTWTGTWDGCSGGRRLPSGPYILWLEALDKATGKMTVIKKTIVAASRL